MTPNFNAADAAYLEQYYGNWITLRDAGFIRHLDPFVKGEYANIYRRSLDPRALFCLTCQDDVIHMIRVLYSNFDKWKAQAQEAPPQVDPPAPEVLPDLLDEIQPDPGDQVPVQDKKRGRGRPKK